jgi:hypothetical protein
MLARDMLTGQLHEVPEYGPAPRIGGWPDPNTYGVGEVYDGLGHSLGMFFLPKLVKAITGGGGPGGLLTRLLPGGGGGATAAPVTRVSCPPCPPCPSCNANMMRPPMGPPGYPYPFPYPAAPRRRRRRR